MIFICRKVDKLAVVRRVDGQVNSTSLQVNRRMKPLMHGGTLYAGIPKSCVNVKSSLGRGRINGANWESIKVAAAAV